MKAGYVFTCFHHSCKLSEEINMNKKAVIFIILLVIPLSIYTKNKYFTGEVYKINKYKKEVICRGPDLTSIENGMVLFICDENNISIAQVKVTRYYTTIIETKLLKGNINKLKIKMPVYSHKSQFENKKPVKVIKYEKDYNYYWYNANVTYEVENKIYKRTSKILLSKLIEIKAKGYNKKTILDADEISTITLDKGQFHTILLKDGTKGELEYIKFHMNKVKLDGGIISKEDRLGKKEIKLNINNAKKIKLINKITGTDAEDIQTDLIETKRIEPIAESKNIENRIYFIINSKKFIKSDDDLQEMKDLSTQITLDKRMYLYRYNQKESSDSILGCCLNLGLFPGVGSFIMGDTKGGLISIIGSGVSVVVLYSGIVIQIKSEYSTSSSPDYGSWLLVGGGISYIGFIIYSAIRPYIYTSKWNRRLKSGLNLDEQISTYYKRNPYSNISTLPIKQANYKISLFYHYF